MSERLVTEHNLKVLLKGITSFRLIDTLFGEETCKLKEYCCNDCHNNNRYNKALLHIAAKRTGSSLSDLNDKNADTADTCNHTSKTENLTTVIFVLCHKRGNTPKRNIANCKAHTPSNIGYSRPSNDKNLLSCCISGSIVTVEERKNCYKTDNCRENNKIRSTFTPFRMSFVNDCSHHRVVNCVPNSCDGHNPTERHCRQANYILEIEVKTCCNDVVDKILTEHTY